MKFPTTIQPTSSLASDMPLKDKQLVVYPCKTLWRALSITHNHNPHVPQRLKTLMTMAGMGKLDHIEERLKVVEGSGGYAFAILEELFQVPNVVTPPKFKVSDFDKYKETTCPKNHLKDVLSEDGGIRKR